MTSGDESRLGPTNTMADLRRSLGPATNRASAAVGRVTVSDIDGLRVTPRSRSASPSEDDGRRMQHPQTSEWSDLWHGSDTADFGIGKDSKNEAAN